MYFLFFFSRVGGALGGPFAALREAHPTGESASERAVDGAALQRLWLGGSGAKSGYFSAGRMPIALMHPYDMSTVRTTSNLRKRLAFALKAKLAPRNPEGPEVE